MGVRNSAVMVVATVEESRLFSTEGGITGKDACASTAGSTDVAYMT